MARVLIVGAGLTGSLCASLLRRELQDKVRIEVWEKSRGSGESEPEPQGLHRGSGESEPEPQGLHRGSTGAQVSQNQNHRGSADLGAQYITATSAYRKSHHRLYAELLSAGVLLPFDSSRIEGLKHKDGSQDFITPLGMGSAEVFFERHVTGLFRRGASWEVQSRAGDSEMFDAVVLTIPQQQLSSVLFSSRFALALFFPPDASFSFSWAARYVRDSSVIVYICHDSAKRNAGKQTKQRTFRPRSPGERRRRRSANHNAGAAAATSWSASANRIKCHKWRYSQVLTGMPGSPGHMTLLQFPLLLCAGDGFSHSNFDAALSLH
ncbi:Renalase [Dissostichus eleginoides]|uniref:Renalase n=1 Tax=Dissostichus eleginoides TaxID=100907 RepID=A0AAD9BDZ8_DISEL|nr:Renalase [Dissostichus eleginoides]